MTKTKAPAAQTIFDALTEKPKGSLSKSNLSKFTGVAQRELTDAQRRELELAIQSHKPPRPYSGKRPKSTNGMMDDKFPRGSVAKSKDGNFLGYVNIGQTRGMHSKDSPQSKYLKELDAAYQVEGNKVARNLNLEMENLARIAEADNKTKADVLRLAEKHPEKGCHLNSWIAGELDISPAHVRGIRTKARKKA